MKSAYARYVLVALLANFAAAFGASVVGADGGLSGVRGAANRRHARRVSFLAAQSHGKALKLEPMPTVEHKKEAGEGYLPGSPLHGKQNETDPDHSLTGGNQGFVSARLKVYREMWWASLTDFKTFFFTLVSLVIYAAFCVGIGWYYHGQHQEWSKNYPKTEKINPRYFPNGVNIGEGESWKYWLMACFCPLLRWSETITTPEEKPIKFLKNFWTALGVCITLSVLSYWTLGLTGVVLYVLVVYGRQGLRKTYGIESGGTTIFYDACCYYGPCANAIFPCCGALALVQEAKQVDLYMQTSKK